MDPLMWSAYDELCVLGELDTIDTNVTNLIISAFLA